MKIRRKVCGDYFNPADETLELMSDGYLLAGDVNHCDDCWDMLNEAYKDDTKGMISEADLVGR
jgi:hypothetical protein